MRTTNTGFAAFILKDDFDAPPPPAETAPTRLGAPVPMPAARSVLEQRYPQVMQSLALLWGHPEMNRWFDRVSSGQYPGLNFEPDAMAEVMLLAAVHRRICPDKPQLAARDVMGPGRWSQPWDNAFRR